MPSFSDAVQRVMQRFQRSLPARAKLPIITLYTRPDCPLCEQAEGAVTSVFGRRRTRMIDIVGNRDLEDRYIFRVPVLVAGGQVVAEGRITRADLLEIRQTMSASAPALEG